MPAAPLRFKVDENLPTELVAMLRGAGFDALSVFDQGLKGANDERVAEQCRTEKRVIVTLDVGFADIRRYPPHRYSGLIVIRTDNQHKRRLISMFQRALDFVDREPLAGHLWILTERGLRIRG